MLLLHSHHLLVNAAVVRHAAARCLHLGAAASATLHAGAAAPHNLQQTHTHTSEKQQRKHVSDAGGCAACRCWLHKQHLPVQAYACAARELLFCSPCQRKAMQLASTPTAAPGLPAHLGEEALYRLPGRAAAT
jgi:hypothetical protein